jgi:serine/threonine-protein kinase
MGAALSFGRYTLHAPLASGGMATVHVGRLAGDAGFGRTVAIKRLHPAYAKDPEFTRMFLDEARLAARIHHPNVVATLDVVAEDGELFLVMEYVRGESLGTLARTLAAREEKMPIPIVASVIVGALTGLDAAHEARDAAGEPLHIVHRDISPQNVMVGADGVARLLDFGVAKARARLASTREGSLKGKIAYMSPEQIEGVTSRQSDVYSVGVVLWELLAGRRLFVADNEAQLIAVVQKGPRSTPSAFRTDVPEALDWICERALSKYPDERYPTAMAMAKAIDRGVDVASAMRVSEWMSDVAGPLLEARARLVADIESGITETKPGTPEGIPQALEEAASKAVQTVSSLAKVADQAVRDSARRMAEKAARDVGAIATALKVPQSNEIAKANERLKAAFAPLVERAKAARAGKKPSVPPSMPPSAPPKSRADQEPTRTSKPPRSKT